MDNETLYYIQQGRISNPGVFAPLFDVLPDSIEELVKIVQGLTIHVYWAGSYGLKIPDTRMPELQLRTMEKRLASLLELDSRPYQEARPIDKKQIGNCRDFSLLLVSMLRHKGIAARARCGFGVYFLDNHYEDHWVVEYWNTKLKRWVMVDAQLDNLQCETLKIRFNPLDVPRDQFIVGGKAWQMCRLHGEDPTKFGIFDMNGMGFIRGNTVRDLAALNRVEMLPWDCWGIILSENDEDQHPSPLIDEIAALAAVDMPDTEKLRSLYETHENLRLGNSFISFVGAKPVTLGFDW